MSDSATRLEALQRACTDVTVEGEHDRQGWHLRGKKGGDVVIRVDAKQWSTAKRQFEIAYSKARGGKLLAAEGNQ